MAHHFHLTIHLVLCLSCVVTFSLAQSSNLPFKAVNLGCWLVTEGWMKPSLFQGIPNNDLLVFSRITATYALPNLILPLFNLSLFLFQLLKKFIYVILLFV